MVGENGIRPIGLEHLTFYDEPVSVFIDAASAAGAASICLSVNHPEVLDPKSLRTNLSRIADANLRVSMGDGFLLHAGDNLDGLTRHLDTLAEFGAPCANACAFEPDETVVRDPALILDQLGDLTRLAQTAGVGVLIEFTPLSHVPTLAAAAELVAQIHEPNLKIMLDTLHLARAGEGPDDIARIDRDLLGYCQVSDGPLGTMSLGDYMMEAVYNRAIPGDGEIPLERILALVPSDVTVSAEVPLQSLKDAGVSPEDRARRIIAGSRRVLARAAQIGEQS